MVTGVDNMALIVVTSFQNLRHVVIRRRRRHPTDFFSHKTENNLQKSILTGFTFQLINPTRTKSNKFTFTTQRNCIAPFHSPLNNLFPFYLSVFPSPLPFFAFLFCFQLLQQLLQPCRQRTSQRNSARPRKWPKPRTPSVL